MFDPPAAGERSGWSPETKVDQVQVVEGVAQVDPGEGREQLNGF